MEARGTHDHRVAAAVRELLDVVELREGADFVRDGTATRLRPERMATMPKVVDAFRQSRIIAL